MSKQTIAKSLSFLGAAIREGQPVAGTEKGPALFRSAGLFQLLKNNYNVSTQDYGDIAIKPEQVNKYPPVQFAVRNLNVLGPLLGRLHSKVDQIIRHKNNQFLLTVGGDHSIGAATISAVRKTYQNLRVVWVDAHPDCTNSHVRNPQKFFSQNYHGMPLSHLMGITSIPQLNYWNWLTSMPFLNPKNVVIIAIRDIDPDQFASLKKNGIKCYTMDHVDKFGIGQVMTQTIKYLDPENKHPFHLSFDIDGVDPDIVGQTGTRFRYGLSGRQSVHIVRRLAHERRLVSMDIVEINEQLNQTEPIRKRYRGEHQLKPVSKTVGLGIDLASSVFTDYLSL